MSALFLGMTLIRTIPSEAVWGIVTGQLKVYGGVIRHAAGTAKGGQIAYHLIPAHTGILSLMPFDPLNALGQLYNAYQIGRVHLKLDALSSLTTHVLQAATGAMQLSGLNLAVSGVSFVVLQQRLQSLEMKLDAMAADVKAIRDLLERQERARFKAALYDVQQAHALTDPLTRRQVLMHIWHTLGPIAEFYAEQLADAKDMQAALAYEEYYLIAALARVRCAAEAGEYTLAQRELADTHDRWQLQARRIARDMLLVDRPERFLFSDTADIVSTSALVSWLDFAYDEDKGYDWLDDLRSKTPHWHRDESWYVGFGWGVSRFRDRNRERDMVVPALHKLTTRHSILTGHRAQVSLLAEHAMTPSAFDQQVRSLADENAIDGFVLIDAQPVTPRRSRRKQTMHTQPISEDDS